MGNPEIHNTYRKRSLYRIVSWRTQGPILGRLVVHFVTYNALLLSMILIAWMIRTEPGDAASRAAEIRERLGLMLYCAAAILPLVIWDMLTITHRVAGPLFRFKTLMREFESTGVMHKAHLRNNDLVDEFCSDFNRFVDSVHARLPSSVPAADSTPDSERAEAAEAPSNHPTEADSTPSNISASSDSLPDTTLCDDTTDHRERAEVEMAIGVR